MRLSLFLVICGLGAICWMLISNTKQLRMTPETIDNTITRAKISGFTVIGIEARTNNAKEATLNGIIPKQWQKFFSEDISAKVPNKTEPNFYAVYSDYASDHNGEYAYLVGLRVKDGTAAPSGMIAKHVWGGYYSVFISEKGPLAKVVPGAWEYILNLEKGGILTRAYKTDFEVYDQRAQDPQNAQASIYIGLK
jgi:predicted transcriptional regulator YdeE